MGDNNRLRKGSRRIRSRSLIETAEYRRIPDTENGRISGRISGQIEETTISVRQISKKCLLEILTALM
jgi:hypothetical protein